MHLVGPALEPAEPAADARVVPAAVAVEDELALRRRRASPHGTSVGMPRRRQNLSSSPRSQVVALVDHGLMAPLGERAARVGDDQVEIEIDDAAEAAAASRRRRAGC